MVVFMPGNVIGKLQQIFFIIHCNNSFVSQYMKKDIKNIDNILGDRETH